MMDHQHSTIQTSLEGTCEKITSRVDSKYSECYTVDTYGLPDMCPDDYPLNMVQSMLDVFVDELHESVSRGEDCEQIVKRIQELNSYDMQSIQ